MSRATQRSFDFETALAGAMPVPFPRIEKNLPTEREREERLKAIINNLEHNLAIARQNVIAQSQSYLTSIAASSFSTSGVGRRGSSHDHPMANTEDDDDQLIAMLHSKPPASTATSKDRAMSDAAPELAAVPLAIKQTQDVLDKYDRHAHETLQVYRDSLRREWERAGKSADEQERARWLDRPFPPTSSTRARGDAGSRSSGAAETKLPGLDTSVRGSGPGDTMAASAPATPVTPNIATPRSPGASLINRAADPRLRRQSSSKG